MTVRLRLSPFRLGRTQECARRDAGTYGHSCDAPGNAPRHGLSLAQQPPSCPVRNPTSAASLRLFVVWCRPHLRAFLHFLSHFIVLSSSCFPGLFAFFFLTVVHHRPFFPCVRCDCTTCPQPDFVFFTAPHFPSNPFLSSRPSLVSSVAIPRNLLQVYAPHHSQSLAPPSFWSLLSFSPLWLCACELCSRWPSRSAPLSIFFLLPTTQPRLVLYLRMSPPLSPTLSPLLPCNNHA